ncbi:DoxX family protein [Micromonospora sp. IBHARD004]|uniref:DoxX family protein n=1 Tax=Micromonospora sp. IBHARD004 TaxID=3457764 RepID=UPI0040583E5C
MTTRRAEAAALAGLLAAAGVTHLLRPGFYDPIVPRALPGPARFWTYASGVAELTVAAAVAHPATRRTGGMAAAALFAAVLPANAQMAYDWRHRSLARRAVAYGRLPVQAPLIWWAVRVARGRS